jgi:hypothetical protein
VDVASTWIDTVLILELVSSRFVTFNSGFGVGKAHMIYRRCGRDWRLANGDVCQRCCHGFNLVQDDRGSDVLRMKCTGTVLICGEELSNFAGKCTVETKV